VEAVGAVVDGVAVELGAQIGAHEQLREVEAVRAKVIEDALQRQGGVGFRQLGGVGEEKGSAAFAANRVLEPRHARLLQLGKVMRDVVEVFGVHLQAQQRRVGRFEGAQIGLAAVFAGPGADQFFIAQDAVRGAFADGQREQVHEAAGAEAGGFLPGRDDLGRGDGVRAPG
jgi:hypothetical protein